MADNNNKKLVGLELDIIAKCARLECLLSSVALFPCKNMGIWDFKVFTIQPNVHN